MKRTDWKHKSGETKEVIKAARIELQYIYEKFGLKEVNKQFCISNAQFFRLKGTKFESPKRRGKKSVLNDKHRQLILEEWIPLLSSEILLNIKKTGYLNKQEKVVVEQLNSIIKKLVVKTQDKIPGTKLLNSERNKIVQIWLFPKLNKESEFSAVSDNEDSISLEFEPKLAKIINASATYRTLTHSLKKNQPISPEIDQLDTAPKNQSQPLVCVQRVFCGFPYSKEELKNGELNNYKSTFLVNNNYENMAEFSKLNFGSSFSNGNTQIPNFTEDSSQVKTTNNNLQHLQDYNFFKHNSTNWKQSLQQLDGSSCSNLEIISNENTETYNENCLNSIEQSFLQNYPDYLQQDYSSSI